MSDLARKMERARNQVQLSWSPDRERAVERGMVRRGKRRTQVRQGASLALALAVLVGGGVAWRRAAQTPATPPVVAQRIVPAAPAVVQLADGSRAVGLDAQSVLNTRLQSVARTVIGVERGGGRFVVAPNAGRVFRVEAREVSVETTAGELTVQLTETKVLVSVAEGRARVMWNDQMVELDEAHTGLFPPDPPAVVVAVPVEEPAIEEPPVAPARTPAVKRHVEAPVVARTWRTLAEEGDYDRAFAALSEEGRALRDDPKELFLASDVMRLSHHAEQSVAPLKQILRNHRGDPQAPMAALTLGRVLLEDLGRPREAAAAFAEVRAIDPRSELAGDALFREVECWSRVGETERARTLAQEYLREFPHGLHLQAVKSFGGIRP